jgi:cell division cycle 14
MGDFNWITPDFLAFASPQHEPVDPIPRESPEFAALPSTISQIRSAPIPVPFKNVLAHFSSKNIGLVVRLNSELYCPSYFTALGMTHMDMIFEDGTCPTLPMVRRFIKMAHDMITVKHKGIAVHCKAGLGRTGCLIGAYLIYRYGFTANEIIAFMRFMRPGMVVGPQQHWLHLNQGSFREWWIEDMVREKLALSVPTTPGRKQRLTSNGHVSTPPNGTKRAALGEIEPNDGSPQYVDENLPAPTPGQPRKAYRKDSRNHPYARAVSASLGVEKESKVSRVRSTPRQSRQRLAEQSESDADELPRVSLASPRSPAPLSSQRSTSHPAAVAMNIHEDVENWGASNAPRTPSNPKSGSGVLGMSKVRSSTRRHTDKSEAKVRKTSGRVGSGTRANK